MQNRAEPNAKNLKSISNSDIKFISRVQKIVLILIRIYVKSSLASICPSLTLIVCLINAYIIIIIIHINTCGQPVNIDWAKAQKWYSFECLAQLEPSQHDAFKKNFLHSYSNVNKMMEYDRFNGINTLKWKKTGNRESSMPHKYSNIPFGGLFGENQNEFNIME